MRPQMNESYGQAFVHTPNLDSLARGGVVFDRAYVQVAWCSPSRNSFLTGRTPDTLQIWDFGKNFRHYPENPPTNHTGTGPDLTVIPLPQWFKLHGFLTLGGGKVYHPDQPPDNDVPYSWSTDVGVPYFDFVHQDCPHNVTKIGCGGCPQDLPDAHFYDWQLANATVHHLRFAKADGRPFFVAAGFRRLHLFSWIEGSDTAAPDIGVADILIE